MASAPPNGSVFATSDPAEIHRQRLPVGDSRQRAGDREGERRASAQELQHRQQRERAGCRVPSGSRISAQTTPATLGRPHQSSATASRDRDDVAGDARTTPGRAATRGGPAPHPSTAPTLVMVARHSAAPSRRGRPGRTGALVTAVRPRVYRGGRVDLRPPRRVVDEPVVRRRRAARVGDASRPRGRAAAGSAGCGATAGGIRSITLLAGLAAVGGVGLGALTPLLTQIAVDDATAGSTDGARLGDRRAGRAGADPVRLVVPAPLGRRPAVPGRAARHAAGRVRRAAAARRLGPGPAAHRAGGVPGDPPTCRWCRACWRWCRCPPARWCCSSCRW